MIISESAKIYAKSLIEIANNNDAILEVFNEDLDKADSILDSSSDLVTILDAPTVSFDKKNLVIEDVFSSQVSTEILNLIKDEYTRILRKNNLPMSDYPLWLLIAEKSKIGYLPDATANYRMLPESASHSKSKSKMYNFDKGTMQCKSIFFNRFKKRGSLTKDSIRNYYEMAFHLRKRMLINYGWIAREQIWPLLKLIPYYPIIVYRSIARKLIK